MKSLWLSPELSKAFQEPVFDSVMKISGKIYRSVKNRKTLRFEWNHKSYFAKLHQGIGWKEFLKNILQAKIPVFGARTEYQAIRFCEKIQIPTMTLAGFGERGCNPLTRQSFLITEQLMDIEGLDSKLAAWKTFSFPERLRWIKAVAAITRCMHEHGMNHQDYYLCHLVVNTKRFEERGEIDLSLMDLHRAQIRKKIPERYRKKDIAALYFSALGLQLSLKDKWRFMRFYRNQTIKGLRKTELSFWEAIEQKALRIKERP